jgi:hypothetical protein
MPLPHSKVIYVCEDVDAASHVVQKRGVQDPLAVALSSLNRTPPNVADWAAASTAAVQPAGAAAPQTAKGSKQTGAAGKVDGQEVRVLCVGCCWLITPSRRKLWCLL